MHEAIPDVGSVPENVTLTGALNQPFPLGARSADEPVTVGASLSILNWRCRPTMFEPSVAVQSSVSELDENVQLAGQGFEVFPPAPLT